MPDQPELTWFCVKWGVRNNPNICRAHRKLYRETLISNV
jgi:hypothetical protein